MRNAGLDEAWAEIKIARRNVNNLKCADDTTLMAESKEELRSLLMKGKEESQKVGLKLNIQKIKIMASGLITSWQLDRETMETMRDFIFLGSKITADDDCSHEIKRCLLLGRKVMTNLFFLLFFNFTILYWFCHISTWIRHRYTRVCHPEPSSLLPPHTIPLGGPSALAPSIQYRASKLDWGSCE